MTASIAKEHPGNASASACIPIAGFNVITSYSIHYTKLYDIWCFSTSVTLARTVAPISALTSPAEPAPMTTRFRSERAGRFQRVITSYSIHYTKLYELSAGADGKIVGEGDFDAQCSQVFANISAALGSAGAGWGNVVQFTTYLVHSQDIARFIV